MSDYIKLFCVDFRHYKQIVYFDKRVHIKLQLRSQII